MHSIISIISITSNCSKSINIPEIFETYSDALLDNSAITLPTKRDYVEPTWHLYPIRVPANIRASIFAELRSQGIGVQVNYIPAYQHPVFASEHYPQGLCPVAEKFYNQEISLPLHIGLTLNDQENVIRILLNSLGYK